MRVIDCSGRLDGSSKPNMLERMRSQLGESDAQQEGQAQEVVINAFQKVLDNKYVMLRGVTLDGPEVPVPLLLIGPPGVRVIYASPLKGIFRAKEDTWEELDDRSQRYKSAKPNLLTRTQAMTQAAQAYMQNFSTRALEVEGILFFSNPGFHVDSTRPVARIVLTDALDRYAINLFQAAPILDQDTVQQMVNSLQGSLTAAENSQAIPELRDSFSFQENEEKAPRRVAPVVVDQSEPPLFSKVPFTKRQWILLAVMILVNIIILVALVVLVLSSP